ncbi:hypothetical protein [Actinomycetospora soli]|uniref:hypothetical protein n=1 Tax=Actinomycetospora soli TaxID=2893887 RepID=UPI001E2C2167|nr:hypothetical protein [Actinomycetospora soli]MCD2187103.1 hypothetical protein [Actinomycetospora soli]
MKTLFTGTPVSDAVRSIAATADVCAWDRVAAGAYLTRIRAFAAVPTMSVTGGEVSPATGLGGSRPAGSSVPQRHVDLDPHRPRPSGGPPKD